ncbi:ABC transporter permease [Gottfriedia luciferensis]|uniref:ABC transporter permease n=1 Tax=Gottfriedia luciferensis TaxID=178774 RepID=UPI000B442982|nr:ABC transporter permease [Gottfriedia luciferensis]
MGDSGDSLFYIILLILLFIINSRAIKQYRKKKSNLMLLGLLISILAPVIAILIGLIFVALDKGTGGDGVGGALATAALGWVIVLNGIIYIVIGIILKIKSMISNRKPL